MRENISDLHIIICTYYETDFTIFSANILIHKRNILLVVLHVTLNKLFYY
jgi:hypothetical protein